MNKIVIALSGGIDSATMLASLLEEEWEVFCCSFYYGSKHGKYEFKAAEEIVKFYQQQGHKIHHLKFDLTEIFKNIQSSLLLSGGEIPEGHYNDVSMKQTVVPGRNTIFASIMMGIAESNEAKYIALGVHQGDHFIYPDCRDEYVDALDTLVETATENKVGVLCPFSDATKQDIIEYAIIHRVPIHLTRTCYKDQELSCGKCGSCVERLEAFEKLNHKDPIKYE